MTVTSMITTSSEDERRRRAVWSSVGVPARLAGATLDNYLPRCPEQERALAKCRNFAEQGLDNIAQGNGLFLLGPVGTGKSHLSVATLRAMVEAHPGRFGRPASRYLVYGEVEYSGYRCFMIPVFELLEHLRQSYRSRERQRDHGMDAIHRCKFDDVVILDDIGVEKPSDWVEEQLYGLIDLRYRMKRSTIITTNCSLKQLESQIGDRTVSRIMEMCEGVKVEGEDWRKVVRGQGRGSTENMEPVLLT